MKSRSSSRSLERAGEQHRQETSKASGSDQTVSQKAHISPEDLKSDLLDEVTKLLRSEQDAINQELLRYRGNMIDSSRIQYTNRVKECVNGINLIQSLKDAQNTSDLSSQESYEHEILVSKNKMLVRLFERAVTPRKETTPPIGIESKASLTDLVKAYGAERILSNKRATAAIVHYIKEHGYPVSVTFNSKMNNLLIKYREKGSNNIGYREEYYAPDNAIDHVRDIPFIPDRHEMINVDMFNIVITKSDHSSPIVKTYNATSCGVVILYDQQSTLTAMIHVPRQVSEYIDASLKAMSNRGLTEKGKEGLQAFIVAGLDGAREPENKAFPGALQPSIRAERYLKGLGIKIALKDPDDSHLGRKVAFDSRNGQLYNLSACIPIEKRNQAKGGKALDSYMLEDILGQAIPDTFLL